MAHNLTLAEMETVISYDRSSGTASIYTADPVVMARLGKMSAENTALALVKHDENGGWYECPKSWIKVQKPRQVSDETKARLRRLAQEKAETQGGISRPSIT